MAKRPEGGACSPPDRGIHHTSLLGKIGLDSGAIMRKVSRVSRAVSAGIRKYNTNLKLITLTFDPEFGFPFRKSFTTFVKTIRGFYPDFEYMGVHVTEGHNEHIHLIANCPKIAKGHLQTIWQRCSQSSIADIKGVYRPKTLKYYLSQYLKNQGRLISSRNWFIQTWQKHWVQYTRIKQYQQLPIKNPPIFCLYAYYRFWWRTWGDFYFDIFQTINWKGIYLLSSDNYWGLIQYR